MAQKTILITGGAGFIGSNFVHYLFRNYPDYKLLVLDALTYAGTTDNLPGHWKDDTQLEFWYGNVRNGELVDTLVSQSDIVIHFAAESHVTRSIYDNFHFFETDVIGTQVVANAVLKYQDRIERLIHISTSEVYGTAVSELMDEDHPLNPASPYAAAKAGADRLVYSYWNTYDLPAVIIRPFNNYGPYQHLEKVVPRFISSCLLNEPLQVHGDGSASRDWLFVNDHCEALDKVMHTPLAGIRGEVINLGTGLSYNVREIAEKIVGLMDADPELIRLSPERPGQVVRHTADIAKAKRLLGWEPKTRFEDGLKATIDWYRQNRPWWEKQKWLREVPIMTMRGRQIH